MTESTELDAWLAVAAPEVGVSPGEVPAGLLLDVARDVAHNVLRPGAPVTAYLLGLAVGRGADPAEAARRISELALAWPSRRDQPAHRDQPTEEDQPAHRDQRAEEDQPG